MKHNIYVASSWRNQKQPKVVEALKLAGHEVFYDFHHPAPNNNGFHWSEIDIDWKNWRPEMFRNNLSHPIANEGFGYDFAAMKKADTCVLVLPCGRSAHLEAGYFIGAEKKTLVLLSEDNDEPELMYKLVGNGNICLAIGEVIERLRD